MVVKQLSEILCNSSRKLFSFSRLIELFVFTVLVSHSFTPDMPAGQLAEQVLAEIPRQALEHFERSRILPNTRK